MIENAVSANLAQSALTLPEALLSHGGAALKLEEVRVDMAELKVESKPAELVSCVGSCIAICIYDQSSKVGGMAHIMLPQASICPKEHLPAKFADTAIPALIKAITRNKSGCMLIAKIAGGANMFPNLKTYSLAIGQRNIEAVKTALANEKIPIRGEDVGGTYGRRVCMNAATGSVIVRLLNGEVKKL
jgi:chemotaxis protein CheD